MAHILLKPVVAISASLKFCEHFMRLVHCLEQRGIEVYYPILNSSLPSEEITDEIKRDFVMDFFPKIDRCSLLYVVNPGGYVGLSVAMEMGYAYAQGKPIIAQDAGIDAGLKPLIQDYLGEEAFLTFLATPYSATI